MKPNRSFQESDRDGGMRLREGVVHAHLGDQTVLLNLHNGVYYRLNSTGGHFLRLLDRGKCLDEIRASLLNEYSIDAERLDADLQSLIEVLDGHGLIDTGNRVG